MTVRKGRRGFFLGCAKYPKCKGTKEPRRGHEWRRSPAEEPGEATMEKITAVTGV